MVNRSQKEQILKCLERHYISPLSQFYLETEVLKRILLGRPFRIQIGVPDSWRFQRCYQTMSRFSPADALARLQLFERYLSNSQQPVFANDYPLLLEHSFPYFEWEHQTQLMGVHQLLGTARIFYFYKGNEEGLLQFFEFAKEQSLLPSLVVIGELTAPLLELMAENGVYQIKEITKPFVELLGKGRSFTNLFSQAADLLLMDKEGTYVKSLSRLEFVRNVDQLRESYFC